MSLLQGDAKSGPKAPRASTLSVRYRPLIGLMVLFSGHVAADEGIDFFEKNIRPVLATRCYEVCEFSLANYLIVRAGGGNWLSAIPVFPFRHFRHSFVLTRRESALGKEAEEMKSRQTVITRHLVSWKYGCAST